LIFAVFERRLIQHWIDCRAYAVFFYIIFAVLVKYHNVNNRHYTALKIVSEFTTSVPCGCVNVIWTRNRGLVVNVYTNLRCLQYTIRGQTGHKAQNC